MNGVQAKDIKELQGYRNPSANIKLGLESLIALVKNMTKAPNWANEVLPALRQEGFKNSILNFDKDHISPKCKAFVMNNYISLPNYDIASFYKASKALGPLAEWTKSILEYADIFERIAPMREELEALEQEKAFMVEESEQIAAEIVNLTQSKDQMQSEFSELVQK